MADNAPKPFFHAAIVNSPDGEKVETKEFDDYIQALFHIFHGMGDEDQARVSTLITERAQSRVRPVRPILKPS